MKILIIKSLWFSMGSITLFLGLTMEEIYLKIVVGLCGLLSILFSLTFTTLLKHLNSHNADIRTKNECDTIKESVIEVFEAKFEILTVDITNLTSQVQNACKHLQGDAQNGPQRPNPPTGA